MAAAVALESLGAGVTLLEARRMLGGRAGSFQDPQSDEIRVWLREPPLRDLLAPRVHELIDGEGLSCRQVAKALQADGHKVNSAVAWQIYHRYYEMIGEAPPKRIYNNGQPRRPKSA